MIGIINRRNYSHGPQFKNHNPYSYRVDKLKEPYITLLVNIQLAIKNYLKLYLQDGQYLLTKMEIDSDSVFHAGGGDSVLHF